MIAIFATPSYGKQPSFENELAMLDTLDKCKNAGILMKARIRPGDPYVSKSRSVLATEFLTDHTDATDFFFVDDDVGGWPGEAAVKLLQRPEDVIAGVYPKKQHDVVDEPLFRRDGSEIPAGALCWREPQEWPVVLEADAKTRRPIWRDGLVLASLVPTGFLRIKRRVLEACAKESGVYPHLDNVRGAFDCYDLFRTGFVPDEPGGTRGRWWGEDFFFSFMVRRLGFEIWVDPDIDFTHSGQHTWVGNFLNALRKHEQACAEPPLPLDRAAE